MLTQTKARLDAIEKAAQELRSEQAELRRSQKDIEANIEILEMENNRKVVEAFSSITLVIEPDPETGEPRALERTSRGEFILWVGCQGQDILSEQYFELLRGVTIND